MDGWRTRLILVASLALAVSCSTVRYSADYDPQVTFSRYKTYDWIIPGQDEQAALERVNPFLERRLQRAVDAEMAQRGIELKPGVPDLLVSVYPVVPARDSRGRAGPAYSHGVYRSPVHVSVGFGFGFGHPYRYGYRYPYFGYPGAYWGYPGWGYPYGWGFGYPYFAVAFPVYPSYAWDRAYGGYSSGVALDGLAPGTLVIDVVDTQKDELVWRGWAEGAFYDMPGPEQLDKYIGEVVGKMMKGFPPPDAER